MSKVRTIGEAILERHGFFSIDQIERATKFSRQKLRDVFVLFCQEGLMRQIKKGRKEHVPGRPPIFSMIYRVLDCKRLASRIAPRRCENTVQDRMWFVIRSKFKSDGSFNLHDLMILAGARRGMVRWYVKALRGAGYIIPSRKGGGPGIEWKLTKESGPKRPVLEYRSEADRERRQRKKQAGLGC